MKSSWIGCSRDHKNSTECEDKKKEIEKMSTCKSENKRFIFLVS